MNFAAPYNRQDYLDFFTNTFLPDDFKLADERISPDFSTAYIKQITKIGESRLLDCIVLEIVHESENDPRVGLSRESFRLMAQHGKKRALALFISPKSKNYRLSLITIDLKWDDGKRVQKEYSNPRRFSFFLGEDCKAHTPQQYLSKRVKDFDDLKSRFSIEVVTKEFYREYAEIFSELETAIKKHNKIDAENLRLFTQTLMNRLMFLRFLERKKWIQFGNTHDYLANLYSAGGLKGQSFYKSRLCLLFFEALAIEGKQNSDILGKAVFLNGGLFEKTELDDKITDIPDTAFEKLLSPAVGREGLFYKYNFTVEESTPIDIEVAVDPEMLGKVFEELVTGRHESGSYYTPRPIVSFMCREAVKGYLEAKTFVPKNAIDSLVDKHEIAADLTNKHAEEILFYLETLKAVDPACGSGAYLLGLLQELIEIRKALQNQQLKSDPDFVYKLKLRLISYCLYGVDLDPFATNIAKLRLWLSLAVESDTPQPLPNLDFKIETGDAILGLCDILANRPDALVMSALRQKAQQLVLKKDQYMIAHGKTKKKLYDEIVSEERAIAEETGTVVGKGIIAWPVHFAEVFTRGRRVESTIDGKFGFMADAHKQKTFKIASYDPGGFDIVLANPPYVRQELIKEIKPKLKEVYPKTYMGTADLYTYFYARAVELLGAGGMLVFISSNKWFRATYGQKLRHYISEKMRVISITDFGELPVFETAATFPMIFVAQKGASKVDTVFTQVKSLNLPYPDVLAIIEQFGQPLPSDALRGTDWVLSNNSQADRIKTMEKNGIFLGSLENVAMFNGVKTGLNDAFIINLETKDKLIKQDKTCKKFIFPFLEGDDVRKFFVKQQDASLIYIRWTDFLNPSHPIMKHLTKFKEQLLERDGVRDGGQCPWFALSRPRPESFELFQRPKIIYPLIAMKPRFTLDESTTIPNNSVYCLITDDLLYVLGVLNSVVVWEYLKQKCSVLGDQENRGRLQLTTSVLKKLPVPNPSTADRNSIAKLVQKCLDAKGVDCEKWEKEIDDRVTALYGL